MVLTNNGSHELSHARDVVWSGLVWIWSGSGAYSSSVCWSTFIRYDIIIIIMFGTGTYITINVIIEYFIIHMYDGELFD
jgi:hypothetical protein